VVSQLKMRSWKAQIQLVFVTLEMAMPRKLKLCPRIVMLDINYFQVKAFILSPIRDFHPTNVLCCDTSLSFVMYWLIKFMKILVGLNMYKNVISSVKKIKF